jgi:NAD+ kinase
MNNFPRMTLIVSPTDQAQKAGAELRRRYHWVEPQDADVIVALGGDGFMLQTLHEMLGRKAPLPVYGMNLGTVGFMMNGFETVGLPDRLAQARPITLHPLCMEVETVGGEVIIYPAINEVSLLRETRQVAKIEITIDGKVRMAELACDGVLVASPAGSTAYNLSASGPILPLTSDLLAVTPISPFRPRRWRGALIPASSVVEFRILEAAKRPVSAVADQFEVRDVATVKVRTDRSLSLDLLFDPEYALDERIFREQFES